MPTGPMRKIVGTVTGVAGSPYYLVGYFDQAEGTTQQCVDAWSTYIFGVTSGSTIGFPNGSTLTVDGAVQIIDPVSGQPTGTESATSRVMTGSSTADFLPPATQLLMRWHTGNYEGGREVRGRTNHPCMPVANQTSSGQPTTAARNAYETRAATLIASASVSHVVWSKKNGLWWATESGSAWSQFSVLRSRRD